MYAYLSKLTIGPISKLHVGLGETKRGQNVNAIDLAAADLELCCRRIIIGAILLT